MKIDRNFTIILILVFLSFFYLNNKVEQNKNLIQDELLEIYIVHNIKKVTDLWQTRVAVNVEVLAKDVDGKPLNPKEVIITIISANGEKILSGNSKDQYKNIAETITKSVLENNNLTRNYEVKVNVIQ